MKLSKGFLKNVEAIAEGLDGMSVNSDFSVEWKVSVVQANLLLEYMYKVGLIEVVWDAEQRLMCFAKKPIN